MKRIGIIGFGKMGQIRAAAMEAIGGFDIVRVFDVALPEKVAPYPVSHNPGGQRIFLIGQPAGHVRCEVLGNRIAIRR